jgi:signal transduction histidine kinase
MPDKRSKLRVGLQVQVALILTIVVLAATAAGGWLYYAVARDTFQGNDRNQAARLAGELAITAGPALGNHDRDSLQKMSTALLDNANVHFVSIIDPDGKTLSKAQRVVPPLPAWQQTPQPVSLSYDTRSPDGYLESGRPIVTDNVAAADGEEDSIISGGVRLVWDTRPTDVMLAGLSHKIAAIGGIIALTAIPLGYLMVWRLLVAPIRRLLNVTRRLSEGDYTARLHTARRDEIGELTESFDAMADEIEASHQKLRATNEELERNVGQRTDELERANRRLRDEMAEKDEFLRAVSHDLNAPLRNIGGLAGMIAMKWGAQLPQEVTDRLARITANVQTESDLINELLELSRIRSRPLTREWVDFGALLPAVRDSFEFDLKRKNIAVTIAAGMPRLFVERIRLSQAFRNLLDNAIKYLGERTDGQIAIGYAKIDGTHCFHVADNGPGVPADQRERIFGVFRRAHAPGAAGVPGKGVGLAVVKSIVSNYEGRVWVEANEPQGAVFYIALGERCTREPETPAWRKCPTVPAGAGAENT